MLVLTRKVGEGIKIDENIFIRVVQLKGKQVRLGIEAPKETKIHREELGNEAQAKPTPSPTPQASKETHQSSTATKTVNNAANKPNSEAENTSSKS